MNNPLNPLNRQRNAVAACHQSLLQRRQRIADTRSHLKSTCACLCARPATLAAAFAAGGLIGVTSTRVKHTSSATSDTDAPQSSTTPVWTTFGALAINLVTRYAASRVATLFFTGDR